MTSELYEYKEINLELVCGRRNSLLVMENWSRKEIGTHLVYACREWCTVKLVFVLITSN